MNLQEFLLHKFKTWKPTAMEVISRTKRDITLSWSQEEFSFLEGELLYRVEKNNKLPKWIVVYSGGKTLKRIDDLPPSHPQKFRLKVILKETAVLHLAEKAIKYYGNENTVYEKFEKREETNAEEHTVQLNVENGGGDNVVNIKITVDDCSETGVGKDNGITASGIKEIKNKVKVDIEALPSVTRGVENQRWVESLYSEETWTSTDTEGTSAVCFCMAVKCGYLKQVQSMLEERPELLDIVNASNGFTPLATAVRKGDINTTKLLLSLGAEINQPSSAGQTPLHLAVYAGDIPVVEHLLEKGANVQARDWNGLRPEHYAVDSCNLEMLKLILDLGGDVHTRDYNGWTPLFRALCQGAKTEMIEELVLRGSDVDVVDNAGLPLASAAKLLKNRLGRSRDSVLSLVDTHYPHEKALANFTRLTKKIYTVHSLIKMT